MDDELTPEQEFAEEYADAMLMRGRSISHVAADLVARGWKPEEAKAFVVKVADSLREICTSPEYRKWHSNHAWNEMLGGIGVSLIGIFLIVGSLLLRALGTAFSIFAGTFGLFMMVGGFVGVRHGRYMLKSFRGGRLPFEQPENIDARGSQP